MKETKMPVYIKADSIDLCQWQSAVAETVRKRMRTAGEHGLSKNSDILDVNRYALEDPMVLGCNLHVQRRKKKIPALTPADIRPYLPPAGNKGKIHPMVHSYLSEHYFEMAKQVKAGNFAAADSPPSGFPDSDYATAAWIEAGLEWMTQANPETSPYIDWQVNGDNIDTFSVITIPENSTIAIIGDFGTGLPDATMLITAILQYQNPDFIIHVGDIYYAGQSSECTAYTQAFTNAFTATGKSVPVFSIPGNHEYYSGGGPFFSQVLAMNAANGFPQYAQPASYFCLRTASDNWQFLGMDTGYNSVHVDTAVDLASVAYGPWLKFSEAEWHVNKLSNGFTGKTVLLSHHQLYSASAEINNGDECYYMSGTNTTELDYLNANLLNVFSPFFSQVSAWFWGHEHITGIYQDNQYGLNKGRLIGDSGYEEWDEEGQYNQGSSYSAQYSCSPPIETETTSLVWNSATYGFCNHGYALLTLSGSAATVDYYQYGVALPSATIPPASGLLKPGTINFSDTL